MATEHDIYIQATLEFWQRKTKRELTPEDAREIAENMTTFMEVLINAKSPETHPLSDRSTGVQ